MRRENKGGEKANHFPHMESMKIGKKTKEKVIT